MDDEIRSILSEAILQQDKLPLDGPSAPMMVLLRSLAKRGRFRELSEALIEFRKLRPQNAAFISGNVAAIVSTALTDKLNLGSAFFDLSKVRPTWPTELKDSVGDPAAFVNTIESIKADLKKNAVQAGPAS